MFYCIIFTITGSQFPRIYKNKPYIIHPNNKHAWIFTQVKTVFAYLSFAAKFHKQRAMPPRLHIKTVFPRYGNSHVKVIFIMGIPTLVRRHLYIETALWWLLLGQLSWYFPSLSSHSNSFEDRAHILHMSCNDLITSEGIRVVVPIMATRATQI